MDCGNRRLATIVLFGTFKYAILELGNVGGSSVNPQLAAEAEIHPVGRPPR